MRSDDDDDDDSGGGGGDDEGIRQAEGPAHSAVSRHSPERLLLYVPKNQAGWQGGGYIAEGQMDKFGV